MTSRIDNPTLCRRAHAPGGTDVRVGLAGIEPTASAPRTPHASSLRYSPLCARKGGDDPPPPGSEPGVLPVTPLPNGASPEGRTPIRGVRARSVTSYRRDAEGGESPARLLGATVAEHRAPDRAEGGIGTTRDPAVSRVPARVRAERVELSWTRVRRLLRPVRLPIPPRPQVRRAPTTTHKGAGGRSTQWTQTGSNRHRPPCRGAALPLVLWAHESAGQESNLPCL